MIFFVAMPFVIGLMNFAVPLQLGVRDVAFPVLNSVSFWLTASGVVARQPVALCRRIRAHRLAGVPALERARLLARGRGRLLPLVVAAIGYWHTAVRYQSHNDDTEDARARHGLHAHADLLLDRARFEPADRRRVPGAHRHLRHAAARPLLRLPLLYQRAWRQPDDVHQPHLDLGSSGGVHPDTAGLRRVFRGGGDLFRKAALRLPLDGGRHHGHLRPLLHGVAAPLLHDGRGCGRQRLLRHHDHGHRRSHRR